MHPIFKVLTALLVIALIADAAFIGYLQFTGRGFTAVREAVTEESAAEEQPLPEIYPRLKRKLNRPGKNLPRPTRRRKRPNPTPRGCTRGRWPDTHRKRSRPWRLQRKNRRSA